MVFSSRTLVNFGASLALIVVAGCSTTPVTNQTIGTTVGAIAGGVAGNQIGGGSGRTISTVLGALAGGVIGNGIGAELDQPTQNAALQAEYNALENGQAGQPVTWKGNDGTHGQVIPQQTYQVGSQNCRRYTQTIFVNGQSQQAAGTACRNPDGTWTPLT